MVDYQDYAAKALRDETLTRSECQAVLDSPDEQLLGLLQAAFTVRSHYFGKTVRLQMLQNAKSGPARKTVTTVPNLRSPAPPSNAITSCPNNR